MTSLIDPRARSGDSASHPSLRPIGTGAPRPMGYQPSLDGVRAVSVMAVLLYHAGFSWMHGGFFGVEVFFVVSGFLITSLLLDERERTGRVALGQFWIRRARRLLPALVLVFVAVGVYAVFWGDAQMQSDLRRDYPWSVFYAANWGQIVGGAQYFGNLSPLRHLWSLAVEEQWYLVWPLLFLALGVAVRGLRTRAIVVLSVAVGVMVLTWWMARAPQLTDDRVNLLYLSTFTRASGLLLGAGAAFVWRPWRADRPQLAETSAAGTAGGAGVPAVAMPGRSGWPVDLAAVVAVAVLLWSFVDAVLTDRAVYRWQLPLVSIASLVLVLAVVHPASAIARPVFAFRPLAELGKRSYGLYLWSWPVSVVCEAYTGSWSAFLLAMAITAVVSELSYRYVETPIRRGALSGWFAAAQSMRSVHWRTVTASVSVAVLALVAPLTYFYASAEHVDPAAGGAEAVFVLDRGGVDPAATSAAASRPAAALDVPVQADDATSVVPEVATSVPPVSTEAAPATSPAPSAAPSTAPATAPLPTAPVLPRRIVVVGDSTAHSLAVNLPAGIGSTFSIENGSVEGCSVYDMGQVRSERSFRRSFANCAGWADRWVDAAVDARSEVALVVLGAWDVFDVEVEGVLVPFASPEGDARFVTGLQQGIDALVAEGVHVALLEVPCMRPQDVEGAGVPALPERADDARVAHLNTLLRQVAEAQPDTVTFVPGPVQWCTDEAISTDLGYRWDGVHVYKPGANLIYMTIAQSLLDIPL